ncbi:hypothetical protein ACGFZP_39365 [Kitasatospora sp. NPDC048239]|uniref:hypothetical protein n=1 Tax=Kitasatospora sp. NPDC048239 TaxID=3364046 RepID=UPI00371AA9A4
MTGKRLTLTTAARACACAGALIAGSLLSGCGAEPGEIPLSEIRADPPTAAPTPEAVIAPASAPSAPAGDAAATTARNGSIASRIFLDTRRNASAILTIGPDGTGEHQLTQPPQGARDDNPDWSPDGATIAFDRSTAGTASARVWLAGTDGEGAHQVGPLCEEGAADCINEQESHPAFSPDGRLLAFNRSWGSLDPATGQVQYSDIYVMSPDGSSVQRLTFLTNDKPYSGQVTSPSWSPDGKQLAFEYRTSATGQPANGRAIFSVNADGTGLRQLTPWELRAGDRASWSPDGTQIVFTTFPAGPEFAPGGGIYTMHADGTAIGALTPGPSGVFYGLASYAPDGKSIVFAQAPADGNADLYVMRSDGSNVTPLTNTPDRWESRPDWGRAAPTSPTEPATPTAPPTPTAAAMPAAPAAPASPAPSESAPSEPAPSASAPAAPAASEPAPSDPATTDPEE